MTTDHDHYEALKNEADDIEAIRRSFAKPGTVFAAAIRFWIMMDTFTGNLLRVWMFIPAGKRWKSAKKIRLRY